MYIWRHGVQLDYSGDPKKCRRWFNYHKKGLISKAPTDLQSRHEQLQFKVPASTRDAEPHNQLIITLCSPLCIQSQPKIRQEFSLSTIQKATPESLSIAQNLLTSICSTFSRHSQLVKFGITITINLEQHNFIHCTSEFSLILVCSNPILREQKFPSSSV